MTAATFGSFGLEQSPNRALPYGSYVFGEAPMLWDALRVLEPLAPGGGIDASVADMTRYAVFQLGDGTVASRQIVSPPMLAELHRPQIATHDSLGEDIHYALGWFTAEYRGVHIVFHNGANPGFRDSVMLVPSAEVGVIVLANAGRASPFVQAVRRTFVEQLLGIAPQRDLAHWLSCDR